ncbi:BppU family phage baseplate upper protein [Enterococcus nangangensis]|uniref:BppU family phage baseplate upper protein n=1 Tax=Enterococcus nangangensis TaxID=2559926 RepID=UPI0010F85372|nr:BppU family phage baseplate upper protein [Enterococcus nangangensis]
MQTIKLFLDKNNPLTETIRLRQGDGGIKQIQIIVEKDGAPVSLANYSMKFEATLPSGKFTDGVCVKRDDSFVYTFSKTNTSEAGKMSIAYFRLIGALDTSVATRDVSVYVDKAADISQGQADKYMSDADKLLQDMENHLANASEQLDEQDRQIAELQENLRLKQAWCRNTDTGEDFTKTRPGENLLSGNTSAEWTTPPYNETGVGFGIYKSGLESFLAARVGENVTFSFEAKVSGTPGDWDMYTDNGQPKYMYEHQGFTAKTNGWEYYRFSSIIVEIAGNTGPTQIQVYGRSGGRLVSLRNFKIEDGENLSPIYTPSPQDDPVSAYLPYVGFANTDSNIFSDYKWIGNPDRLQSQIEQLQSSNINARLLQIENQLKLGE